MVGITRINIIKSDWNDWRIKMSKAFAPIVNVLLRDIFQSLAMPLLEGEESIECTEDEAIARYDHTEGIDTILRFKHGGKATLQEKGLTYKVSTATWEEKRGSGGEGAFYYCSAQYYLVYYARKYLDQGCFNIDDWILLDLPAIHRADARGELPWQFNRNSGRDGRWAPFRYIPFDDIPPECVITRYPHLEKKQLELK